MTDHLLRPVLCIGFFLFIAVVSTAQGDSYAQIKIVLSKTVDISTLQALHLDIDHIDLDPANNIRILVTPDDRKTLDNHNIPYEVLIPDYRDYYNKKRQEDLDRNRNTRLLRMPTGGFGIGSMGGFYTLEEIENKLDDMHADFPNLTTPKFSIGRSIENREIWAIKISDNPTAVENEAVVYYDALHHSREPLSMAVTLNFMFWLLENYSTNDQIKYLVDNRELFFVPCVNPDGYEYNRLTDPNGGGLWRKNRRDNGGCFGVDLNRNYSFEFGHDASCASSDPCSNTFKGPNAFSEPETVAVRDFLDSISPQTAFSVHSTAGSYLMPYGYNTSPPQYDIYSEWASDFLSVCDYPYGVTFQMLGYTSCGTTRDYLHSEGIYGWTPEIDGSGFWPLPSEILSLVDENIYPLYYQAWISGDYAQFQYHQVSGDALIDSAFQIQIGVKNKGVGDTAEQVQVFIQPQRADISVTGNGFIGAIPPRSIATTPIFNVHIPSGFSAPAVILDIIISQDSVEIDRETIIQAIGVSTTFLSDDAESGAGNWTSSGTGINWGINGDDAYSGSFSFGDSDNGNGVNNTANFFTLNNSIDLTGSVAPKVEFYSKWSLESGDVVQLQLSTDGGGSWLPVRAFIDSEPWHQEIIELNNYTSAVINLRFMMTSDGSIPSDGFYFDDFIIKDYNCIDCPACLVAQSEFPLFYSFETGYDGWTQSVTDSMDWTRDKNGTPSSATGPDTAHDGYHYDYVEASSPNFPDQTANFISPCYDFSAMDAARLYFAYHMYGSADSLKLDVRISTDGGSTWSPSIWSRVGNFGNQWNYAAIDLAAFVGHYVNVGFFAETGETWQGDVAIDQVEIKACPQSLYVDDDPILSGRFIAGDSLYSDKTIPVNQQVIFSAGNQIKLLPNFEVENGADLELKIEGCFD